MRDLRLHGFAVLGLLLTVTAHAQQQLEVPRLTLLPDRPTPYLMRDWRKVAHAYDRLVFDEHAKGQYLPLIWRVPNTPNLKVPGFGIPSYVGKEETRGKTGEGIAALGALLGATAVGIDKTKGPTNWLALTEQYVHPEEGIVLNNAGGRTGSSFWYELLPGVVFTQLASRYPTWTRGREISRAMADSWVRGTEALDGNFDHTSFNFGTMKPYDNGLWKEPEAAAAVAYLELFESLRSPDPKYLKTARRALDSMHKREENPTYEVLTAHGALAAAYLNAEKGDRWDVPRFVDWCFEPTSPYRTGWGMIVGRWGEYDVGGLMGSTNDGGGYAFAMNTYLTAATLAPLARYDDRFSASIAKWLLNAANASRLFYRNGLPDSHQSSANWTEDKEHGIAYEALRRSYDGKSPYATGDAKRNKWAAEDFGLYGGGYVGLLGALVHPTNVPEILRIDLRATDDLPTKGYPTDLYWNPYPSAKTVQVDLGKTPARLYDAVANRFLSAKPTRGVYALKLKPKQSVQLVRVPGQGKPVFDQNRTLVAGIPIDYNNGRVPLVPRVKAKRTDLSVKVPVSRAKVGKDGSVDWSSLKSGAIAMAASGNGTMRADVRFAWDEHYLYVRVDQRAPATKTIEAPSRAELGKHPWDFENVILNFDPSRGEFATANSPEVILGWSSQARKDLSYSALLPNESIEVSTSGTSERSDRVIEARIAWQAIHASLDTRTPLAKYLKPGLQIACQPLLTDGTFERQAYVGGARYARPTGYDVNSRTLVLESR